MTVTPSRKPLPADVLLPDVRTWSGDGPCELLFVEPEPGKLATWPDVLRWFESNRAVIDTVVTSYGGIVLRGFSISSSEDFSELIVQLGPWAGDYSGGASPRTKITGQVMEATKLSEEIKIPLHQEMAYLSRYPSRIIFYSKIAAAVGGETIVGDMRAITVALPGRLRRELENKGVMIVRNFAAPVGEGEAENLSDHPDLRSWPFALYTEDRSEVEEICRGKGMEATWNEDDSLTVSGVLDAFTTHPDTRETLYRNVIHVDPGTKFSASLPLARRERIERMTAAQARKTGYYLGDGSTLSPEDTTHLSNLFDSIETGWRWHDGDIMLLDNLLTAHGRNPFQGSRDVQVGLLA